MKKRDERRSVDLECRLPMKCRIRNALRTVRQYCRQTIERDPDRWQEFSRKMFVGPVVRLDQVPETDDETLWILNFLGY